MCLPDSADVQQNFAIHDDQDAECQQVSQRHDYSIGYHQLPDIEHVL